MIQKFVFSIDHLETYMLELPHHPMHVNLSGSICIRLANLFARFGELKKTVPEAEDYFIKGYKLFYSQGNDQQKQQCIDMSTIFLKKYLTEIDERQSVESGTTVTRAPAFLPPFPQWESRIALTVLLESYRYKNYEMGISKRISEGIDHAMISIEIAERERLEKQKKGGYVAEFSQSVHFGTTELLASIAETIKFAYDGIFDVSIARAHQHKPRMGDFKVSDEISIGFGYTAQIEYPLENAGMIEHQFIPGTNCPEDIHKLFTGVVTRQLREFIVRISNPKVLSFFLTPAERQVQEQQKKDTGDFIDLNRYAIFHEVFVEGSNSVEPLIYHQKKFKNGSLVGSEILVRFQNPDSATESLLPLHEAFAFLDLFEQYKVVSRRIMAKAMEEASSSGHPFSLNVKCEELMDPDFSEFLLGHLEKVNRSTGDGITLEILESSALDSTDGNVLMNLKTLKAKGFHFALDDFRGTDDDYDKFNKLRMIHIPQEAIHARTGAKSQNLTYVDDDKIKNHAYLESNFATLDELATSDEVETPKDIPIFGEGDEVKFDHTNKATLQLIHDITKDWPENRITLKEISKYCDNDVTSPILRLVNLISYCKYYGIKYTIEQIRDQGEEHLLRIANLLGFIVQ